jgi:hypothetical protein
VVQNLLDVIAGREPALKFDGYTSCPLLLREGAALLMPRHLALSPPNSPGRLRQ